MLPVHDGDVQPRKEANSLVGSHGIFHDIQLHGGSTMIDLPPIHVQTDSC